MHLQELFKDYKNLGKISDNGILMVANDNRIVPYRALLYGGAHETSNVKIIVYYSKY